MTDSIIDSSAVPVLVRYEPALGDAPGRVLHLTLNRPESRNAMSLAMVDALLAALSEAEAAGDVRIIVLRGARGHFCAGAATGGTTLLWDLSDRSLWADIGDGQAAVLFAVFSPDGSVLLTAQADGSVNLWPMDVEAAAPGT